MEEKWFEEQKKWKRSQAVKKNGKTHSFILIHATTIEFMFIRNFWWPLEGGRLAVGQESLSVDVSGVISGYLLWVLMCWS